MRPQFPEGKRYNSFAAHCKAVFGERLQKLVIDAGFTCPNRDGTLGRGGCTFCDNAAFHPGYSTPSASLARQLDEGIAFSRVRYPRSRHYLAYFQAYTGTYAPLAKLQSLYVEALSHPEVVGLVIGTRPDCVEDGLLDWLADLSCGRVLKDWARPAPFSNPLVRIEFGIESCHDETLRHVNRGHGFGCAQKSVWACAQRGLKCGAHFIIGLPGETREMILGAVPRINALPLDSVKFHQLQFVKGTPMEAERDAHPERFLDMELSEYLDFVIAILERLRPDIHVERVAGEVPPRFVRQPRWGLVRNFEILRMLDERLEAADTWQGRLWAENDDTSQAT